MRKFLILVLFYAIACQSQPIPTGLKVRSTCVDSLGYKYAATSAGIYRTSDNVNWQKLTIPTGDVYVNSITTNLKDTIYAGGVFGGVLRSTNHGEAWSLYTDGLKTRSSLDDSLIAEVYPLYATRNIVAAPAKMHSSLQKEDAWYSLDYGVSWHRIAMRDEWYIIDDVPWGYRSPSFILLFAHFSAKLGRINQTGYKEIFDMNKQIDQRSLKVNGDTISFAIEYQPSETYFSYDAGETWNKGYPTNIERELLHQDNSYTLLQNYPNPFNPVTNISFTLPRKSFVSLQILDRTGREVAVLISGNLSAGSHSRQWDAADFPSGIYLYRIQINGQVYQTKKLTLLK